MNWEAISAISDFIASIAVVFSLIYLAKQIHHANLLSHSQTRRDMLEMNQNEIYKVFEDPVVWDLMLKETITHEERIKLHSWLVAAMRLREFEWSQHRFGTVDEDTYNTYKEVIPIILGTKRSRSWWENRGRMALNHKFVEFVNKLIEPRPLSDYWDIGENW